MKLSDRLRARASKMSKWPGLEDAVVLLRRAADELDRREARINRLKEGET